jgi:hypothetical protein
VQIETELELRAGDGHKRAAYIPLASGGLEAAQTYRYIHTRGTVSFTLLK